MSESKVYLSEEEKRLIRHMFKGVPVEGSSDIMKIIQVSNILGVIYTLSDKSTAMNTFNHESIILLSLGGYAWFEMYYNYMVGDISISEEIDAILKRL